MLDEIVFRISEKCAMGLSDFYSDLLPSNSNRAFTGNLNGVFVIDENGTVAPLTEKEVDEMRFLIVPVGIPEDQPVTGVNAKMAVSRQGHPNLPETLDFIVNSVSGHTLLGAVYEKNPDGSIQLNPGGYPKIAKDENGNAMIGPIILKWKPNAIKVRDCIATNNKTQEMPILKTQQNQDIKVGAFIGGGGEEGSITILDWGVLTD